MQDLNRRLTDIGNRVPLPKEVYSSIWESVAHLTTHTLVEGYVKSIYYLKLELIELRN